MLCNPKDPRLFHLKSCEQAQKSNRLEEPHRFRKRERMVSPVPWMYALWLIE